MSFGRCLIIAFLVAVHPAAASCQLEFTLKNTFIEKYKDRVTIDASYTVDKAHKAPNSAVKDGDLHIAGRAPEIGLATVAEIMNAAEDSAAVAEVHSVEGTGQAIPITGAWRIWPEHGGQDAQVQGKPLSAFTTTNPEHIFEIHPITKVATIPTSASIQWIEGYTAKDAETAFTAFENHRCKLVYDAQHHTTMIQTPMIGDNYVEFLIVLNESPRQLNDGYMVMSQVLTLNGDLLIHKRRMVLIGGTKEADAIKSKAAGDTVHVLGIPRIDLSLVSYRTGHRSDRPDALTWNLPYEMIIVGVKE